MRQTRETKSNWVPVPKTKKDADFFLATKELFKDTGIALKKWAARVKVTKG